MMYKTSLQFISPKPLLQGWRGTIFVVGVLMLAWGALKLMAQSDAIATMESKIVQLQPRSMVRPVRTAAQQRQLDNEVNVASSAVRQLNLPIRELIMALQPPQDIHVSLLSLDVSGKGAATESAGHLAGVLKVAAEAKTPQEMMTYVAFLGDQRLFKSVYLIKHEINANSPEKPYRFQLEAQWQE